MPLRLQVCCRRHRYQAQEPELLRGSSSVLFPKIATHPFLVSYDPLCRTEVRCTRSSTMVTRQSYVWHSRCTEKRTTPGYSPRVRPSPIYYRQTQVISVRHDQSLKKWGCCCQQPKFREETPTEGSGKASPSPSRTTKCMRPPCPTAITSKYGYLIHKHNAVGSAVRTR